MIKQSTIKRLNKLKKIFFICLFFLKKVTFNKKKLEYLTCEKSYLRDNFFVVVAEIRYFAFYIKIMKYEEFSSLYFSKY